MHCIGPWALPCRNKVTMNFEIFGILYVVHMVSVYTLSSVLAVDDAMYNRFMID